MNKVHVLDCTLRDGGYCNQWRFGFENTKSIIKGLVQANIDIIECGFLTNKVTYNKDITTFNSIDELSNVITEDRNGKIFVVMMNYGEYDIDDLPNYDGSSIDGIRVAFHKKDVDEALLLCNKIKEKGYKVFVQAMVSLCYSDDEFFYLICKVNELQPYAFYIVDSFGNMKQKDLTRLFYVVEHNLKENIWIGFHSHNNMQLAYSNAQSLVCIQTNRNLIIDSSIYGMGRGAGNLNTELFVEYLNENTDTCYILKPLLVLIDEILNEFYQKNYWGYSLPNYLAAAHNAHPNYAGYLDDKKTLTVEDINEIFETMDNEKKFSFNKSYIEGLYLKYMEKGQAKEVFLAELKAKIKNKQILLIAPGKSSSDEYEKICSFSSNEDVITISINFDYQYANVDYVFLSNIRRFKDYDGKNINRCIVTSNIPTDNSFIKVSYVDLLNDCETVQDNAGLMAIKFLIDSNVKKIYLAGFDGYSHDDTENYGDSHLAFITKDNVLDSMNEGISQMLSRYSEVVDIEFLTKIKYVKL